MSELGNWRDNGLRMSVACDLFAALESQAAIFNDVGMRTYVGRPDFDAQLYAEALRWLNEAMRTGLDFMSGARCEGMPLVELYDELSDADRLLVDRAFDDAVGFYGYWPRLDGWRHLRCAREYLRVLVARRGALESGKNDMPELLLHHALALFLAESLWAERGVEVRAPFISEMYGEREAALWRDARRARAFGAGKGDATSGADNFGGPLKAVLDAEAAGYADCDEARAGEFKAFLTLMRHAADNDAKTGPAIAYGLSRAAVRDYEIEGWEKARSEPLASGWRLVWTPANRRLGSIGERHDGLWFAGGRVAESEAGAIGALMRDRTRVMGFQAPDGSRKEARVHAADGGYGLCEGEFFFELWDADAGVCADSVAFIALDADGRDDVDVGILGIVERLDGPRVWIRDRWERRDWALGINGKTTQKGEG